MSKSKILITGGSGLIGSALVAQLYPYNEVVCIGRSIPPGSQGIRFIEADLSQASSIDIIVQANPDIIIHCAAVIPSASMSDHDIYQTNTSIDLHVIEACRRLHATLIYFSSTIIYGYLENDMNISELKPPHIISNYAKQKLESEEKIEKEIEQYIILRINAPYSEHMKQRSVMTIFADKAIAQEDITLHGSGSRMQDFTYAGDIAICIRQLIPIKEVPSGIYNISSGSPVTMLQLAELMISKVSGCTSKITTSGQPDPQEAYKASYNLEKAKIILRWAPSTTLETGIGRLVLNRKKR